MFIAAAREQTIQSMLKAWPLVQEIVLAASGPNSFFQNLAAGAGCLAIEIVLQSASRMKRAGASTTPSDAPPNDAATESATPMESAAPGCETRKVHRRQ